MTTPSFRITGLSPDLFRPLFALPDVKLHQLGARRVFADDARMPCRVSMAHAEIGEELLLLNYEHQRANTPYRSTHAIYVRKLADQAFDAVNTVPDVLSSRLLAIRAFDASHMMIDAEVCEGTEAAQMFERFLSNPYTRYLHVHNARRGCYAAKVERVTPA
jgi:Protein of unknown function (DUF1203)